MNTNDEKVQSVIDVHPDWGRIRIAREAGLPASTVQHVLKRLRNPLPDDTGFTKPSREAISDEQSDTSRNIQSQSVDIRTPEELIEKLNVDTDVWYVKKSRVSTQEIASIYRDQSIEWDSGVMTGSSVRKPEWVKKTLYNVRVWLELNESVEVAKFDVDALKADAKKHAPKYKAVKHKAHEGGCVLELSIPDLHFGRLCWHPESGHNYDIAIAREVFVAAVKDLLGRTTEYPIERVLFVLGNDYFNVNSSLLSTVKGTVQDEDCRWRKSYVFGRRLAVEAIDLCRDVAPVEVMVIPGNHDAERIFYLGDSLECWYDKCDDVVVDNSPTTRKYFVFGKNLLGFTHGHDEKMDKLPLIMATERGREWGSATYREIHIGHLHHRTVRSFVPSDDYNGVRVRILPSLVNRDAWEREKGYDAVREAIAMIWDKDKGCVAEFNYHP